LVIGELNQQAITEGEIENILTFSGEVRRKMEKATFDQKSDLIQKLNVRVDLVRDEGEYLIKMTSDLPGSDYAQIIHRTEKWPLHNT
jgi:hypothetical protein